MSNKKKYFRERVYLNLLEKSLISINSVFFVPIEIDSVFLDVSHDEITKTIKRKIYFIKF